MEARMKRNRDGEITVGWIMHTFYLIRSGVRVFLRLLLYGYMAWRYKSINNTSEAVLQFLREYTTLNPGVSLIHFIFDYTSYTYMNSI